MEKEAMKNSIETILQLIGLTNDRNTLSKDLSGGMKRRLSIGISLINDPKVCCQSLLSPLCSFFSSR
jgi:ABC-2 type transport system ATP-binding protein